MQNKFDSCIKRNITQKFSNNVYIYKKNCFKKEFNNCINFPYLKRSPQKLWRENNPENLLFT